MLRVLVIGIWILGYPINYCITFDYENIELTYNDGKFRCIFLFMIIKTHITNVYILFLTLKFFHKTDFKTSLVEFSIFIFNY